MKKWIFGIVALLAIGLVVLYSLIPAPGSLANNLGIKTNIDGAYRILSDQQKWDSIAGKGFHLSQKLINSIELIYTYKNDSLPVSLLLIPVANDSIQVNWQSQLPVARGLFKRWNRFSSAVSIRENIETALLKFRSLLDNDENIYGLKISQTSTTDTSLIVTRFTTKVYPSIEEIYQHVHQLQSYASQKNAIQTGSPMLNATKTDSNTFKCMVAIPINGRIDDNPSISFVRMIPGQFLRTTITGGPSDVAHGHQVMQQYFKDYKRISMAIPFEVLVTDRSQEKDTSKWITHIYGPVY